MQESPGDWQFLLKGDYDLAGSARPPSQKAGPTACPPCHYVAPPVVVPAREGMRARLEGGGALGAHAEMERCGLAAQISRPAPSKEEVETALQLIVALMAPEGPGAPPGLARALAPCAAAREHLEASPSGAHDEAGLMPVFLPL